MSISVARTAGIRSRVRVTLLGGTALALFVVSGVGALSASAAPATTTTSGYTVVSSVTNTDASCLTAIKQATAHGHKGLSTAVCTRTVTLSAGPAQATSVADVTSLKGTLSDSQYQSLVTAAAAGAVKHKPFSQQMNNITDSETQYGTFYYDGSHAWVKTSYRGYQGTHLCRQDWAVGYAVENKACTETGSTSQRNLIAHWHFTVIPSGGSVNWDEIYILYVNSAGKIWQ